MMALCVAERGRRNTEIILDLPFGFPINNIISQEAGGTQWCKIQRAFSRRVVQK